MYIDIDPIRPAGISSTEEEHDAAIAKAYYIRDDMKEHGWYEPVICDSGNGASLLYKIDMENNKEALDSVKNVLNAMDYFFSDEKIQIDQAVFNAARIVKLYGTKAKKGDSTGDRPHRDSKILEIPGDIQVISPEHIQAFISKVPKEPESTSGVALNGNGFDIEKWLQTYDIAVRYTKLWNGGTVYSLNECPFDSNHKAPDSSIIKHKSGAISFHCFHNSCVDHTWKELRDIKEPNREPRKEATIGKIEPRNGNDNWKEVPQYEELSTEAINQRQIKENNRKLEINLPDDHFVSLYVKWQTALSDAYEDYHIGDALWILSAITRGKVVLDLKQELVKPNLWIFNIGKSTTSRKSTAVNKTRKIYETATDIDLPNDDYSIEGYLESLSNYPITNNVRDEASGLLAKFHKKYNEGIFDLECQLYDGQNIKKTLASGGKKEPKTYSIKNPYVTKLYATTGDNFARYMQIEDFTCGYGFRWIYTYPKYKKDRMALALTDNEDLVAWGQILTKIKTLYTYFKLLPDNLQFNVTDEAMKYHDTVCIELERAADEQNNDILNSVIGRSGVHIIKIAMLLEIGKNQISDTITLETMTEAAQMVTRYFIPSIMDLIEQLQEDVKNNKIERIKAVLRRLGGKAAHVKVLRDCNLTAREFNECIETMMESRALDIVTETNTKAKIYILLNHNKEFEVRDVRNVSSVRTLVQHDTNSTNITNLAIDATKGVKTHDVYQQNSNLVQNNESYEPYELNEQKHVNTVSEQTLDPFKINIIKNYIKDCYSNGNRPSNEGWAMIISWIMGNPLNMHMSTAREYLAEVRKDLGAGW